MLRAILPIILLGLAGPAVADDSSAITFGGDAFMAGRVVTLQEPVDDLFIAGDKLSIEAEVAGTLHAAGRYVSVRQRVGENLYGAGMEIDIDAPVAGDVTVMGDSLTISEPVSGDLRALGSRVRLEAPVAGYAILAGESVGIDGAISGDLSLATDQVEWFDGASVGGEVHVYTDTPESVDVPASVADASRVVLHASDDFDGPGHGRDERSGLQAFRDFLGGILVIGLLATLLAAFAPEYTARLRERAVARPLTAGVAGFVGLSTLIGSVVLLALTGFGLLLVPLAVLAAVLLGLMGYVVGAYALGVWATGAAGRGLPETTGDRALAAFAGAALVAVIGLVPWLGWLAVMAVFIVGAGAVALLTLRRMLGAGSLDF